MKMLLIITLILMGKQAIAQWQQTPNQGGEGPRILGFFDFKKDLSFGYMLEESETDPKLYQTHDSGYTWKRKRFFYTTRSTRLNGIKIMDNGNVLIISPTKVHVLDTTTLLLDTIYSFEQNYLQPVPLFFRTSSMYFFDKDTGFVLANNLFRTTDGGKTWNVFGNVFAQLQDNFHFVDRNNGFFLGMTEGYKTTVYSTTDGGLTWDTTGPSVNTGPDPTSYTSTLTFVSKDTGFIGGKNSCVYRTVNRGKTWEKFYCINDGKPNGEIRNLKFINSQEGWITITGREKNIFKTVNGGKNYYPQPLPSTQSDLTSPNRLHVIAPNLLFLDGASIGFYRTFNQGGSPMLSVQQQTEKVEKNAVLYPNPATRHIFLTIESSRATIVDITGKQWWQGIFGQEGIDIGFLPTGLYFLKTEAGTTRFVKE